MFLKICFNSFFEYFALVVYFSFCLLLFFVRHASIIINKRFLMIGQTINSLIYGCLANRTIATQTITNKGLKQFLHTRNI